MEKRVERLVEKLKAEDLQRKAEKITGRRTKRKTFSPKTRAEILRKTNGRCHLCGSLLKSNAFVVDHVQSHARGGSHDLENLLPACRTCNLSRWHFSESEVQFILKLGVWARRSIVSGSRLGKELAKAFLAKEVKNALRRKPPNK